MNWCLNKWVLGDGWTKPNIDFWEPHDVYFLERYEEISESVTFGQKLRYFTDQNGPKGAPHEKEF